MDKYKVEYFKELALQVSEQADHDPDRVPQQGIVKAIIEISNSEILPTETKEKRILHLLEFYHQLLEPMCICNQVRINLISEISTTHENWGDEGTNERPV